MISDEVKEDVTLAMEGRFPKVKVKYVNVSFKGDEAFVNYIIADRGNGEETIAFPCPVNDLGSVGKAMAMWLGESL